MGCQCIGRALCDRPVEAQKLQGLLNSRVLEFSLSPGATSAPCHMGRLAQVPCDDRLRSVC